MPEQRREEVVDEQLVSTIEGWYEVVTKDAEGVAHVHRLYKHSTKTRPLGEDIAQETFINQARPTIIKPGKRIRPDRDTRVDVFFGDTHHPFHNRRRLQLAMIALKELAPDTVTFLGDDVDNALFSRFESKAEWAGSTQQSLDEFHQTLAQVRAEIPPESNIVVHEGNHNIRLEREIRKYNGELLGLRRANAVRELGVLSLEFLLRIEELGVEYVRGYPASEYWHGDNLRSFHGHVINSNGSAVAKEIKTETANFVHGHTHKAEILYRNVRIGRASLQIFGMSPGTFADMTVPSHRTAFSASGDTLDPQHDWHTTLGVVFSNGETVAPYLLPITDESIDVFGKVYRS